MEIYKSVVRRSVSNINNESVPNVSTAMFPSEIATTTGATVMSVFFAGGVLGNLWIVLAILTKKNTWNIINIFILSLCINDLLTLCLIVILIIDSYIQRQWAAGMTMCKLNPEFTVAFAGCSLWHTGLIAVHRYIVVVHNNFYRSMSKKAYVIFVLIATRLIPFACAIPGLFMNTSGYVPKLLRCVFLPNQGGRIISVTMVQIVLPCVIVVLCYMLIFTFVYRVSRRMQDTNMVLKHEIQITKMFGVVFLMILFGFIPYAVVRNIDKQNVLSADLYVLVTVCYGIATCSSPLIYGLMSSEIRIACAKFAAFCLCSKSTGKHGHNQMLNNTRFIENGMSTMECRTERISLTNLNISRPSSEKASPVSNGTDTHENKELLTMEDCAAMEAEENCADV